MKHASRVIGWLAMLVLLGAAGSLFYFGWQQGDAPAEVLPEEKETVQLPEEPVAQDTVATLCVAGDLVMHMPIVNEAYDSAAGKHDFTYLFEQVRPYYEQADYAVACLETTFNGPPYSGFPMFCAPDELAADLKTVGFDLLSTSGNHSLDKWHDGLVRTLDVLDAAGMDHVGTHCTQAERDAVKVIDVGGIRLALLAYTYGTNGMPLNEHPYSVNVYTTDYLTDCSEVDYDMISADLERAMRADADAIAVYMHWGQEYSRTPSEQQTALADFLFENGATLVLGGHVHVPQPMELRQLPDGRTGFLCYCLGNFISNQHDPYTNLTAAVNLELTKDAETGAVTVSGCEYIPMYMLHPDASNEGRYRLLDIKQTMQDYENGDTSVIGETGYQNLKQGLTDLRTIFGTDEVLL